MKKSNKTNLLILGLIFVLLIGSYFIIKIHPPTQKEDEDNTSMEVTITRLLDLDVENIKQFSTKSSQTFLSFEKAEDSWGLKKPYPVKLNQMAVQSLIYTLSGIEAQQTIEVPADSLADYGLNNPRVKVEISLTDQTTRTLYLGDRTPDGKAYYFMIKNDPKIYVVSEITGNQIAATLDDFRDKTLSNIDQSQCNYLKLSRIGNPSVEIIQVDNISTETDMKFSNGVFRWKMIQPYQESMGVNHDVFQEKILNNIGSLNEIDHFVADNSINLSSYGLAPPQAELILKDQTSTFTLQLGYHDKDDTIVYCKIPEFRNVFAIKKEKLAFLNVKPMELIERFAYLVNIANVNKILIQKGSEEQHVLTVVRKKIQTNSKEKAIDDKREKIESIYHADGNIVSEKAFTSFYKSLIGLLVESEISHSIMSTVKPEFTTTFYLDKNPKEVTIEYFPYNYDFYAVSRNGKIDFLISREQVKKMYSDLNLLLTKVKKTN